MAMIFTVAGQAWTMHPARSAMSIGGGAWPATNKRAVSGQLYTITPGWREPRSIDVRGGDDHVISAADAAGLMNLYAAGSAFAFTCNYFTPDASSETWSRCMVLSRPVFREVAPGYCTYEFAISEVGA